MTCNVDDVPNGSMLQVDSPEPTLLKVEVLDPKRNYQTQSWKNGLGKTSEISIYPPEKDFRKDSFFWRLSENFIEADFNYPILLGYEYTNLVLPSGDHSKSTIQLNHRGEETSTTVTPLFPYSWNAEWATSCKVIDAPLTCLQFLIKRELGAAQFSVDKLEQLVSNEDGETGRKLVLGAFALVYVIEGHIRVGLDENSPQGAHHALSTGQTLYVERDEDASPTSMTIQVTDASGGVGNHDQDATIVIIQITETKKNGAPSTLGTNTSDYGGVQSNTINNNQFTSLNALTPINASDTTTTSTLDNINISPIQHNYITEDAPSRRREPRRKGSLVVYDDQPFWNLPQDVAKQMVDQEMSASASAIPISSDNIGGELATTLKRDSTGDVTRPEVGRRNSIAMLRDKLDATQIYKPPKFSDLNQDTDVPPPVVRDRLVVEDFPKHTMSTVWIKMVKQGLSEWIRLPVIVCRGSEDGPVVGITAAVHGNELNGVPCIHRVVSEIDVRHLRGTVVAVPCVNVSGYLKFTRDFADGRDLNRLFPGREDGFASQVYCYQLMNRVISQFNYLIDLHTASFGRVNSYYVRADMNDPFSATMARLQQPQIVLHNSGQDGTLRSAASARGIRAITVEIGNPQLFQSQYVQWSYVGVMRILDHLKMYTLNSQSTEDILALGPPNTILCSKGFWIYTRTGGVLEVYPGVNTIIQKNDLIARIKNIFGNVVDEYYAPCSGIVIGRSSNPVAMSGDRIIHLGVIKKKNESLPKEAKENY
ncbi:uncharacterized protein BX663DRAFT_498495 [Cokeromyces recurvatus]|uniref:uncharacterized protein n=1 Tax=Cokeromyces recurvatus TaxID=90255 RepID=UPI002220DF2F|nr:uncharacterized protein BX663DRAFT_498495 [Cokeromyces recurvatus]KAI7906009.1 hypothetical protein BX663DRAFT_498495 [Cokeromyces recurvatus]